MRKKILLALLPVCFLFTLLFLSKDVPSPDANIAFERLSSQLFQTEVQANALTLHYTLLHPENYGIQKAATPLGSFSTDNTAYAAALENYLSALDKIPSKDLSKKNRQTYEILHAYLSTAQEGIPFALYEEPLSPVTGIQSQLPILLSEFQFHTQEDVDIYFTILQAIPAYFQSLCQFQQAKASASLFMSPTLAEQVIEECNTLLQLGEEHFLYTSFESRLHKLSTLSNSEKEHYTAKNKELLSLCVFPAYEDVMHTLKRLKSHSHNTGELCHLPDGTAYYRYLIKKQTGSSRTIEELETLIKSYLVNDLNEVEQCLRDLQLSSKDTLPTSALTLQNTNPMAILSTLKEQMQTAFPAPPGGSVEIKYVQKELADYVSPAFYLIPAIDHTTENVIYINEKSIQNDISLFTTLAHEGYPGHLYQTTYFSSTSPDPIRSILNFGGYTEGWATYSEMLSYSLLPLSPPTKTLLQKNASVLLGMYALTDIGIHFHGWSFSDAANLFHSYGITDLDTVKRIYDIILGDPGNYLTYHIGYLEFLELKKQTMKQWGEDFTQKKFHQIILETGPAPFDYLGTVLLS